MNEFGFLENLRSKYSLNHIGDDCAVLPLSADRDLLVTADMLVEDVDFRLNWTTPEFLGHKSLAVSLSDIAAMGGTAKWSIVSLAVPPPLWKTGFPDRFYEGWFALAREFGVELIGGDISRSPNGLVIDSTVGGEASKGKAFLRSTARSGDLIYVSGDLGGAAGGLKLLESGMLPSNNLPPGTLNLLLRQLQPVPELSVAKLLQSLEIVTAAIDVSDGLSSDLGHICEQSGVGAIVDSSRLPIDPDLAAQFPAEECLNMALNGGEDFRLLFTIAAEASGALDQLGVTRIGEITSEASQILLRQGDQLIPLESKGFRHF